MTDPAQDARHVFVDPSGQRAALLRRGAWLVTALLLLSVASLVFALIAPPQLTRLLVPGLGDRLPGAAAPRLQNGPDRSGSPRQVLPMPTALPSAEPSAQPASATPSPTPTPTPAPQVPPRAPGSPTSSPAASATPINRPTAPPGQSKPTPTAAQPTPTATSPGQGKPTRRPAQARSKPTASPTP